MYWKIGLSLCDIVVNIFCHPRTFACRALLVRHGCRCAVIYAPQQFLAGSFMIAVTYLSANKIPLYARLCAITLRVLGRVIRRGCERCVHSMSLRLSTRIVYRRQISKCTPYTRSTPLFADGKPANSFCYFFAQNLLAHLSLPARLPACKLCYRT